MEGDIRPMCREGAVKKRHPQDCPTTKACDLCDEKVTRVVRKKHDRHSCPVYNRTISPCPLCLSAHGDDVDPKPEDPYVRQVVEAMSREPEKAPPPGAVETNIGCVPLPLKFGDAKIRALILEAIAKERERHQAIGFHVDMSDLQFLRIMTEELGEVAKALDHGPSEEVEAEAVQLAAATVAFIEQIRIKRGNKLVDLDLGRDV